MKSKFDIEKEIQKTMSALDNLERVEGNPYLFTKIKAQLEKENEANTQKTWQLPTAISWATMALLLVLNIFAIQYNLNSETTQDSLIEIIASDYGFEEEESDYFIQN